VALVCVADGIVGVSFGATAVAGGLPWWVPVALSVLVFAGGSQIAAVGVVLGGGSPLAAVAAGAVLNTRLFPYGLAVADVIRPGEAAGTRPGEAAGTRPGEAAGTRPGEAAGTRPGEAAGTRPGEAAGTRPGEADIDTASGAGLGASGEAASTAPGAAPVTDRAEHASQRQSGSRRLALIARQLVGTHLITDESTAFALRQSDPARRRAAFWSCGAGLFAIWNVTVLLGVLAGSMIKNTDAFGLDATFPAVMLALALPTLTSRSTWVAAGTGAVLAVALTPVLPAGLPLLAALGGLGTRWRGQRGQRGRRGRRGRRGWLPAERRDECRDERRDERPGAGLDERRDDGPREQRGNGLSQRPGQDLGERPELTPGGQR
jgi:predicted branched-subunit amino acid permease